LATVDRGAKEDKYLVGYEINLQKGYGWLLFAFRDRERRKKEEKVKKAEWEGKRADNRWTLKVLNKGKNMDLYHFLFKYIIVGDSNVGKSCLLLNYTEKRFVEEHDATIGVEFGSSLFKLNDHTIKI
jgi:hypothetical protein